MSIGLKNYNTLYHGTSSRRAKSIWENGFQNSPVRYDRWLGADGIYFVSNRPLIALRFAEVSANNENSKAVVLSVNIKTLNDDYILDLTSDIGLHNLFNGYSRIKRAFRKIKLKHEKNARTPDSYDASVLEVTDHLANNVAVNMLELNMSEDKSCNWDSPALRLVTMESHCLVIVAAIQEGTSFNRSFVKREFASKNSPNYKGLRLRDHIEVCVLDASILAPETLREHPPSIIKRDYEDLFVCALLDTFTPDAT